MGKVEWGDFSISTEDGWRFLKHGGTKRKGFLELDCNLLGRVKVKWGPFLSRDETDDIERIMSNYEWGIRHKVRRKPRKTFKTSVRDHEARLVHWFDGSPFFACLVWRCRGSAKDFAVELEPSRGLAEGELLDGMATVCRGLACHLGGRWGFDFDLALPGYDLERMLLTDERGTMNLRGRRNGLTISWWEGESGGERWRAEHFEGEISKAFADLSEVETGQEVVFGHVASRHRFAFSFRPLPLTKRRGEGVSYLWECPGTLRRYALTMVAEEGAMEELLSSVKGQALCHRPAASG